MAGGTGSGSRRAALLGFGTAAAMLVLAGTASADLYWANKSDGTIERAHADGSNQHLVSGITATAATGVAVSATHLYWSYGGGPASPGSIGRVTLAEASPNSTFIATTTAPLGLALDATGVYWDQLNVDCFASNPPVPTIGRANQNGFGSPNNCFVPTPPLATSPTGIDDGTGATPCGLATDADKFFWALDGPDSIRRGHGVIAPFSDLAPGAASDPCGVAEAGKFIYWANRGSNSIGRVGLDGLDVQASFIDLPGEVPCGVAVDGNHIYWTDSAGDAIERADTNGTIDGGFGIPTGSGPCAIAVDPTAAASPAQVDFGETSTGTQSGVATLLVQNTSSSSLDPTGTAIEGPDAGDFTVTADGCSINVLPAGNECVLNVSFSPTAVGDRAATLKVTSNATNDPVLVPLSGRAVASAGGPSGDGPPIGHQRRLSIRAGKRHRLRGGLESDATPCVQRQSIVVYQRRRGDDRWIGADRSGADGRWSVRRGHRHGRFYAVAERSLESDGSACLDVTSRTVHVG